MIDRWVAQGVLALNSSCTLSRFAIEGEENGMTMRVNVDHAICQGHAACYFASQALFAIRDDDGRAIVLLDPVPTELVEAAQRAEAACPERAITVTED